MATIVITVIGDDKAGLVETLSGAIADSGGNWDRSHMAELAGKFAGVVEVTIPAAKATELLEQLNSIESSGLLHITAEIATDHAEDEPRRHLTLRVVGPDHAGIVHEISHYLAEHDISIEELETEVVDAPMGGHLFQATATVSAPEAVDVDDLSDALERVAPDLVLELGEVSA